jgi:hypothetical protein
MLIFFFSAVPMIASIYPGKRALGFQKLLNAHTWPGFIYKPTQVTIAKFDARATHVITSLSYPRLYNTTLEDDQNSRSTTPTQVDKVMRRLGTTLELSSSREAI